MTNTAQMRNHLLRNVPPETIRALAKTCQGYSLKKLHEDKEALVDELIRVCDRKKIEVLCDEFFTAEHLTTWFFTPEHSFSKEYLSKHVSQLVTDSERKGLSPEQVGVEPELYRVEEKSDLLVFHYVARDQNQNLALSFGEKTKTPTLSYYSAIVHFSEPCILVFGPYAASKAQAVVNQLDSKLELKQTWTPIKPDRGLARDFYKKLKAKLGANLVETKRQDPKGNYRTVALQSKHKEPDLEKVVDFQNRYLHAESYYDVLEFSCKNALGLPEVVHVKFGHPFGRFTFRAGTPLSGIIYVEKYVKEIATGNHG
jgi:hypothetical protein